MESRRLVPLPLRRVISLATIRARPQFAQVPIHRLRSRYGDTCVAPPSPKCALAFAEREIMECRLTSSLALDVRRLNDRPPSIDFGLLESSESFRALLVA